MSTVSSRIGRLPLLLAACLSPSAVAFAGSVNDAAPEITDALHMQSPDWRDQIIYFLMIDRFDDGDPANNDQGAGEYDPSDGRRFSGGDLAGITRRLDYIQGLGATSVWITPPVANQWWDGSVGYGGYHGYWAENFVEVDKHFGELSDYQALSRALHGRGMSLIQDIVLNHTGNFFDYSGEWVADKPGRNYQRNRNSTPVSAPSQWPFSLNNPRRKEDSEAAIYHWTPPIRDVSQRQQELTFQLANLDDINTESPLARKALRQSYGYWIEQVGVDAFRLDTAFYVPTETLHDFMHADDVDAPGVMRVAKATGRDDFHLFGEGFGMDRAGEDAQMRKIERYATDPDGGPLLPGMINFTLYGTLTDVFARGQPTGDLADRITRMMKLHRDPHRMPTFVDNHDVDRFLAGGSEAALRQALLLIMTLPGIPTLYYGTEQGFSAPRQAMFANGFSAGGRDHFDTASPLYRYIKRAIALRRAHPVLSRGTPVVLRDNSAGPGVLAYKMTGEDGADLLIVFNTAESPALLDNLELGSGSPQSLRGVFAISGEAEDSRTDALGKVSLMLPARSGQVWEISLSALTPKATLRLPQLRLDRQAGGTLRVSGEAPGYRKIELVLDGQLASSIPAEVNPAGHFVAELDTRSLLDPTVEHRLVAWAAAERQVSGPMTFKVTPEWTVAAEITDPRGDDAGPKRRYRYPTDLTWGENRQMDLLGARVFTAGGSARLELDMQRITRSWNPSNDFDHVAFSVFISLPARNDGIAELPLQNARMPDGLRWHYRLRTHGWSNAMYSSIGASASDDGTPNTPGASISVDREKNRLTFLIPAAALGNPHSLQGASIYVSTWDYDGGYRKLSQQGDGHTFGGGDGSRDPLIMDDLLLQIDRTADAPTAPPVGK